MISLFHRTRTAPPSVVTLPTHAVTQREADDLAMKREAQLQWMREKGLPYLGDPLELAELRARRRPSPPQLRLVETQRTAIDER